VRRAGLPRLSGGADGGPGAAQRRRLIKERPGLRPNTVQVYQYMLAAHRQPFFGNRAVADIREAHVRRWRGELLDSGVSPASVAKAYRLIKAIMSTAVDDGIVSGTRAG
jgi:Phage integrase, N-terminal SAM-like domain